MSDRTRLYSYTDSNGRTQAARLDPEKVRAWVRAARTLSRITNDLGTDGAPVDVYMSDNELNLMLGPSHQDAFPPRPLQGNAIESVLIRGGGGDW
jgi:hypothetical protein